MREPHGAAVCPLEGDDADALTETFDTDDAYKPVMLVTLGYTPLEADDIENERKLRRSVDEIVDYGTFSP